jgi:hypothetical protein
MRAGFDLYLEHLQEKWNPVFRPKCDKRKNARAVSVFGQRETALAAGLGTDSGRISFVRSATPSLHRL